MHFLKIFGHQEQEELAKCTFTPTRIAAIAPVKQPQGMHFSICDRLNKLLTLTSFGSLLVGPVLVHGLDKFLERKAAAEKLQQEQREREEKAFLLNPPARPDRDATVH